MRRGTHHNWIKWFAAALSLSLLSAALGLMLHGSALTAGGGRLPRPFVHLGAAAGQALDRGRDYFQGMEHLRAENAQLRREAARWQAEARRGQQAEAENRRLRTLLDFDLPGQDLTLEPAWPAVRVPDNWQGALILNRGSQDQIREGQCAINETGALVGRVVETSPHGCTLALVTDGRFHLPGQGTESEVLGTLEGDWTEPGSLRLTGLTRRDPLRLGEMVVTYGTGSGLPSGLAAGRVTDITDDPGGLTRSARLTPAADLDRLGQVFVVTQVREER